MTREHETQLHRQRIEMSEDFKRILAFIRDDSFARRGQRETCNRTMSSGYLLQQRAGGMKAGGQFELNQLAVFDVVSPQSSTILQREYFE